MILERTVLVLALAVLALATCYTLRQVHLRRIGRVPAFEGLPTLLYFAGATCAYCPAQSRIVDQVSATWDARLRVTRVDAEHDPETAARYSVFTLPTTIIIDGDGRVHHVNYGLADESKLNWQLKQILDSDQSPAAGIRSTQSTGL